jgi:hypothetical protein
MNVKKPLMIASLVAAAGLATVSMEASAADPALGALVGGGIGAAIGHAAGGHGATAAGAVVGAVVGSSIAASENAYYGAPAYGYGYAPPPAPVYTEPVYTAPAYAPYYAAPPVYYGPSVVVSTGPYYHGHVYRHWDGHHYYRHH